MKTEIRGQRSVNAAATLAFRLSVIPFSVATLALLAGCVAPSFPTPYGDIRAPAFFHKAALPKGTYTITTTSPTGIVTNFCIVIEGYTGAGDSEAITATAGGIRSIVEGAASGAAKGAIGK
jgi:hypothetical protein